MPDHFTTDDVHRLARLAHLALTPEEADSLAGELRQILAYVEQLRTVDTSDVPPTSHAVPAQGGMRDDEPQPSLPRDLAIAAAPAAHPETGLFKVPRVIG